MIGRLAAADGTLQDQRKLLADPALADELAEAFGPQGPLDHPLARFGQRRDHPVRGQPGALGWRPVGPLSRVTAGHVRPSTRSAARSATAMSTSGPSWAVAEPASSSGSTAAMAWSASRGCQPRLTRPART